MNKSDYNTLFFLQDNFNLCLDTLCKKQIKNTTNQNRELIKQIQYYIWLNKTINKKKHKDYSILNTIKHFDS